MSEFTQALGLIAPWYNLVLAAIVVYLFITLFIVYRRSRLGHIGPWVWVFIAVLIYIAEAVFTVLRSAGAFHLPYHVNGYFELAIISIFIYALLSKREYIHQTGPGHRMPLKKRSVRTAKKSLLRIRSVKKAKKASSKRVVKKRSSKKSKRVVKKASKKKSSKKAKRVVKKAKKSSKRRKKRR